LSNLRPSQRSLVYQVGLVLLAGILLLAFFWWLYLRRGELFSVLNPFLVSFILAYLLSPVVQLLETRGISRFLSIVIIYLMFFIFFYVLITGLLPSFIDDIQALSHKLPDYMKSLQDFLEELQADYHRINIPEAIREIIDENLENLQEWLVSKLEKAYSLVLGVFDRLVMLLLVPVLTFYLLYDEDQLKDKVVRLVPARYRRGFLEIIQETDQQLGAYARGIIIISLVVGVASYLGFLLLGLDFPLVLGIIAGITNLIPYLGPFLGAIPAVLVAFLTSPALVIKVIILILVIQQLESQLIAPVLLGRTLKFHPLAIILALLLGGKIFGFVGLLLALPVALVMRILGNKIWGVLSARLG